RRRQRLGCRHAPTEREVAAGDGDPHLVRFLLVEHSAAITPDVDAAEFLDVGMRDLIGRNRKRHAENRHLERERQHQTFRHVVELRSAVTTVAIPSTTDAASASLPIGALGSWAPTRRFPTMNAPSVSAPSVGARSSTRAAISRTRKWRFHSARSGCCTYPKNAAMGRDTSESSWSR